METFNSSSPSPSPFPSPSPSHLPPSFPLPPLPPHAPPSRRLCFSSLFSTNPLRMASKPSFLRASNSTSSTRTTERRACLAKDSRSAAVFWSWVQTSSVRLAMNCGVADVLRCRHSLSTARPMCSQRVDLRRWYGVRVGGAFGAGFEGGGGVDGSFLSRFEDARGRKGERDTREKRDLDIFPLPNRCLPLPNPPRSKITRQKHERRTDRQIDSKKANNQTHLLKLPHILIHIPPFTARFSHSSLLPFSLLPEPKKLYTRNSKASSRTKNTGRRSKIKA